jgi:uncharacterized membrane protein
MTSTLFFIALEISVIACGLVAGVFLTFSDFVMRALDRSRPAAGVEVMQVINREVFRTVFMVMLLGMSTAAPLLIGYAYLYVSGPASGWVVAGGALYLAGVFGVTLVFNVPMNQRLDTMDYAGADAASYWAATYMPRWTFWNHARAIASAAAAACFLVAGILLAQAGISVG